ncbi:hypothetical protein B0T21DRAFT_350463 [Apiosordaria backusii]|uniref:Uncharacterized protein n=1 Tax=Apiosordaria backusii TaxID=314023 RepID=A0AA40B295_9PEZI|nr:hypothetical protein B0T21DRAFT_350463 [Apiosordaria backusii]
MKVRIPPLPNFLESLEPQTYAATQFTTLSIIALFGIALAAPSARSSISERQEVDTCVSFDSGEILAPGDILCDEPSSKVKVRSEGVAKVAKRQEGDECDEYEDDDEYEDCLDRVYGVAEVDVDVE